MKGKEKAAVVRPRLFKRGSTIYSTVRRTACWPVRTRYTPLGKIVGRRPKIVLVVYCPKLLFNSVHPASKGEAAKRVKAASLLE